MSALTPKRVDQLNVGLVIISLVMAVYFPYRGFLVAYAILGPLHYLTELNWLHSRDYFVKERKWIWVALAGAVLLGLPKLSHPQYPTAEWVPGWMETGFAAFDPYTNGLILITFLLAITFVLTKNKAIRWAVVAISVVLAFVLKGLEFYALFFGLLLPTLVHVYLFTLLFMFFGARKSRSTWGYVALALAALVAPLFIALFDPNTLPYVIPDAAQAIFVEIGFYETNALFGKSLGLTDGRTFSWYGKLFLRLQIFITFAYIYHYLNWFSKTTIIGWHKNLSAPRTITMVVIWGIIVALFAYDYKVGFLAGLGLSFLHVMGEFPLNIVTIRSLFSRK